MTDEDVRRTLLARKPPATYQEWLEYGLAFGFCGPVVCITHDGYPTTREEDRLYENGDDACIAMIRPYPDAATRQQIEENHAPSVWRQ